MKPDEVLDDRRLKEEILQHIKSGKYRLTEHAAEEQANGNLDLQDTLRILKAGRQENTKRLKPDLKILFGDMQLLEKQKRLKKLELSLHFWMK